MTPAMTLPENLPRELGSIICISPEQVSRYSFRRRTPIVSYRDIFAITTRCCAGIGIGRAFSRIGSLHQPQHTTRKNIRGSQGSASEMGLRVLGVLPASGETKGVIYNGL
jgi:hypothetical protein